MDLSKLTTGDKVIAGSGIALFIFSFFPWFGLDTGFGSYSESGWSSIFSLFAILIGMAMVAVILLPMFGVELPELGQSWSQILFIAGIVAGVLILLQLLDRQQHGRRRPGPEDRRVPRPARRHRTRRWRLPQEAGRRRRRRGRRASHVLLSPTS